MSNARPSLASLNLSEDNAIESILSDIPFFCVGLMTFGIFTFILVLKRVNVIALHLYASSFLAFGAAIFDLGHILTEVRPKGNSDDPNSGLVTTREVGFALSLGFTYVFMWHFVAHCPHNERRPASYDMKGEGAAPSHLHSASWRRWGIVGLVLQWSLLGLALAIPALQIAWRIAPLNTRFGTVYIAEATIEIVVSAIFILKILLNIFLSRLTPWWQPVQVNIAPLIALGISTGLGLGNLLSLAFSETILGRFLRAVEMYILILFVLITTFYGISPDLVLRQNDSVKSFMRISEKSMDLLPRFDTPPNPIVASSGIIPRHRLAQMAVVKEPKRPSIVTWILPRRSSRESIRSEIRELVTAEVDNPRAVLPNFVRATETHQAENSLASNASNFDAAPLPKDRPWTAASIPSYYKMERHSSTDSLVRPTGAQARETDSPVYGLNGIIARARGKQSRPGSSMSFDELLRQQTELDKSIAALRLYSSEPSDSSLPKMRSDNILKAAGMPKTRGTNVPRNSLQTNKHESASNRSEFSLSNFPEPPAGDTDELPTSAKLERLAGRARVFGLRPLTTEGDNMVAITVEQTSSLPVSPNGYEGTPRMESAGTQYDVTSFIGGLTQPQARSSSLLPTSESVAATRGSANEPTLVTVAGERPLKREVAPVRPRKALPTIPRGRNISGPSLPLEERDEQMFERPRPAPFAMS